MIVSLLSIVEISHEPNWAEIAQTGLMGGQLVLLAVAAVFGWRQLREAKELREEQTRPFVVVDLAPAGRPKIWDLVIKNVGSTLARDIRFSFDPALESSYDHVDFSKLKMLSEGIKSLPPGREYRTTFDGGPSRFAAGLPDTYQVTIDYTSANRKRRYREEFVIDVGLYWNRGSVEIHDIHDVHTQLEAIRRELESWGAQGGGVRTVHDTDDPQ